MNTNRLFVLGPQSSAMDELEALLRGANEVVAYATAEGRRVIALNAHKATSTYYANSVTYGTFTVEVGQICCIPVATLIFVECGYVNSREVTPEESLRDFAYACGGVATVSVYTVKERLMQMSK